MYHIWHRFQCYLEANRSFLFSANGKLMTESFYQAPESYIILSITTSTDSIALRYADFFPMQILNIPCDNSKPYRCKRNGEDNHEAYSSLIFLHNSMQDKKPCIQPPRLPFHIPLIPSELNATLPSAQKDVSGQRHTLENLMERRVCHFLSCYLPSPSRHQVLCTEG